MKDLNDFKKETSLIIKVLFYFLLLEDIVNNQSLFCLFFSRFSLRLGLYFVLNQVKKDQNLRIDFS